MIRMRNLTGYVARDNFEAHDSAEPMFG
jgi:hypothetical protein